MENIENTYKQVPFDIELAKNILNGKVDGKVGFEFRLADGSATEIWYAKSIHALNNKTHPYYVIFEWNAQQYVEYMTEKGYLPSQLVNCFIELTEEAHKHEFKPFDRVLVRNKDTEQWFPAIYTHMHNDVSGEFYALVGNQYATQCIPYEGNEHLVGTTDNPK